MEVRILVGSPGNKHGYTLYRLRDDGTFVHCHETKTNDNRIKLGDTNLRVESGPWAEVVTLNYDGTKLDAKPLTIAEARDYISRWNEKRKEKGYCDYEGLDLDFSRIFEPESYPEYEKVSKEYK